jgi:arabinose-5-phosphate isomerase
VEDLMRQGEALAVAPRDASLRDALFAITRARAGAAAVIGADGRLAGIITDGDIRRAVLADDHALSRRADDVMTRDPKLAGPDEPAIEALRLMKEYKIGDMPVVDADRRLLGMLNLKDMLDLGME